MIQVVSGEGQVGPPGRVLPDSVAVQVLNHAGEGLAGVGVRFEGEGVIEPEKATTDATGVARAVWVLGPEPGEQRVQVVVDGSGLTPASLTARAEWGPEARIEAVSGGQQRMPVGCALPEPLRVRVTDAAGAPVPDARVYIAPPGTARSAEVVLRTNAEGVAEFRWTRVEAGRQRMIASVATREPAEVAFTAQGVPTAPEGYAAIGNRIVSSKTCRTHRFVGVARPGLQSWPDEERLSNPDLARQDFETIRSWGANVVRLPVNQRYWQRDLTFDGRTYRKEEYRELIDATIRRATAAGLDVIVDLHVSDRGDPNYPDHLAELQQMADDNHSIPFWKDIAAKYKDNGRVIFQLYNEPNQISWEIWRNGGSIPGSGPISPDTCPVPGSTQSCGAPFEAAGMQELYDAVRSTGAQNLVIVNGVHWGYDLSRVPEFAVKGENVVYATHPYDWPDKQPSDWDRAFGKTAAKYPVMIAEFGDYSCNRKGYYDAVLDYADDRGISWVAWAWKPPAQPDQVCSHPTLILDWGGTPSPTGKVVRARMQAYSD